MLGCLPVGHAVGPEVLAGEGTAVMGWWELPTQLHRTGPGETGLEDTVLKLT